jgi:acetyltransferase-like isoleucine patch superfamily enzyme
MTDSTLEHDPAVTIGAGLQADAWVAIGERTGRPGVDPTGSIGPHARLRRGTIIYAGSRIGAHLETGHFAIIREQCRLGDHVSVWSHSVVDYGVTIGHHVQIHTGVYIAQFSTIEDDVFIAPGVKFANDPHPVCAKCMRGPTIKRSARLGVGVVVLHRVTALECPYGLTPYDVVDGHFRDVAAQGLGRERVDDGRGPPRRIAKPSPSSPA